MWTQNRNLIVNWLTQFRREHEEEADITEIEVPLPLLLNDICIYLHLTKEEREAVLGPRCTAYIQAFMDKRPIPTIPVTLTMVQPAAVSRN